MGARRRRSSSSHSGWATIVDFVTLGDNRVQENVTPVVRTHQYLPYAEFQLNFNVSNDNVAVLGERSSRASALAGTALHLQVASQVPQSSDPEGKVEEELCMHCKRPGHWWRNCVF